MRPSAIALGEKTFEGDYRRIWSAGEIQIINSDIQTLCIAGEVQIHNSKISKARIAGELSIHESIINDGKLLGEIHMTGNCQADVLSITGELSAEYLECRILKENKVKDGDFNENLIWNGYMKAETFEHFHDIHLSFEYAFQNIISSGYLTSENEITCEYFYSFHGFQAPMVNAENITILLNDNIHVDVLAGSTIWVSSFFHPNPYFEKIPKTSHYSAQRCCQSIVSIPEIEGDSIHVECIKSHRISGKDVVIGDLCIIERVEYTDHITISEKAIVNEVIHL